MISISHQLLLFINLTQCHFYICSIPSFSVPNIILGPKTQVALSGANVTFSCGTGPNNDSALLVSWQRNGQSISLSKHRQTLEHIPENGSISTLHLEFVNELNEGMYQVSAWRLGNQKNNNYMYYMIPVHGSIWFRNWCVQSSTSHRAM